MAKTKDIPEENRSSGIEESDELAGLWEVFSTSDGETVVRGIPEDEARAHADEMARQFTEGKDAAGQVIHDRGPLAETYAIPAGLDADGNMQFNEVRHDPPLERVPDRVYDVRPCRA